jgi:diguanylate cyclase (GGDEF)-like protein/PAS domain S-box-containing protein
MAKDRLKSRDDNPTDTIDIQLGRLISAHAQLQSDIDARHRPGSSREVDRALLTAIINLMPELVYAKDTQGRFVAANDAVARDHGLQQGTELIGKTDFDLFPRDMAQRFFDNEQQIIATGEPMIDKEHCTTDEFGAPKWMRTSKVPMRDDQGTIIGLIGVGRNITRRKLAEQEWEAERALYRAMIDQVPDYLFVKDRESRFLLCNRAVAADLGLRPDELIGKTDFELHPHELASKFFADEQRVISSGEASLDIEEYVLDPSGKKQWLSTSKVPLRNDGNEVIGIVGVARNVSDRKHAEDQIRFMALHDVLTGLPNRSLLMDRLTQALLQAERSHSRATVIFIDLDNFKLVNDSLGHNAGDLLLKVVAERMVGCVRTTDTVARLGGDEFVILLTDQQTNSAIPAAILDDLQAAIAVPIPIEGQQFHVTCSIGVATFPEDGRDPETLLMNADVAMYQAKESGRGSLQFYTAEMNEAAFERRMLQEGLREAIVGHEFELVYQPQVEIRTGAIFATEALVRWHHPKLGVILPTKFIPLAEESGLIVPLGDWVLREACRQNKAWQDAGLPPISVCVNVSARQFREKNWVTRVSDTLRETGLDPKYLELELTESVLMHDIRGAVAAMRELGTLGVHFSIDDFGTGYSSLSALKSFPAARLKIDQSFVRNLAGDANDRKIARAVISLGQKLNMRVIAEGVETDEQLAFLQDSDCDEIQGYHFSKPVESKAIAAMLRKQSKAA